MKYCNNCKSANEESNSFCINCGCKNFSEIPGQTINKTPHAAISTNPQSIQPFPAPNAQIPLPPTMLNQPYMPKQKKSLNLSDLLSILGFVAAIIGMFSVSILLHPLAAITSIIGFKKGTRLKGLAIAGFVIAITGGITFIAISLYQAEYIPKWLVDGAFH